MAGSWILLAELEYSVPAHMSLSAWIAANPATVAKITDEFNNIIVPSYAGLSQAQIQQNNDQIQAAIDLAEAASSTNGNPVTPQDIDASNAASGLTPADPNYIPGGTPPPPPPPPPGGEGTGTGTPPSPATTPPPSWTDALLSTLTSAEQAWTFIFGGGIYAWFGKVGAAFWAWINTNIIQPFVLFFNGKRTDILTILFGEGGAQAIVDAAQTIDVITSTSSTDEVKAVIGQINQKLTAPQTIMDRVVGFIMRLTMVPAVLASYLIPVASAIEADSKYNNPQNIIEVTDLIKMVQRGLLDPVTASDLAKYAGMKPQDFNSALLLANSLTDPLTGVNWLAKGIIQPTELDTLMRAAGVTATDQANIQANAVRDPDPVSSMAVAGKQQAAAGGFAAASLDSPVPAQILALYARNNVNPAQATLDWLAHWQTPPVYSMLAGFFKGIYSQSDLNNAAAAGNFPLELLPQAIADARPVIPARVLATLYSRGSINEATLLQRLALIGYSPADAALFSEYVVPKTVKPPKAAPGDLSKVAQASAAALYDDNVLTAPQYTGILQAHGYTADAAALQVQLTDIKNEAANRKAAAAYIVNQADLGQITIDAATSELIAAQYSPQEVARYVREMHVKKASTLKGLTYAQAAKVFSKAIEDETWFTNWLTTNNYDPAVIPLLVQLEGGAVASTNTP